MKSILRNDRGAAVIELALIAPVLALTVIGIVDMSNAYSRKLLLEQGAQRAVEKIGQTTETATVESTLATEAICRAHHSATDLNAGDRPRPGLAPCCSICLLPFRTPESSHWFYGAPVTDS